MLAGFAIIVGVVVAYTMYAALRTTQRGHEESGLYGEAPRQALRDARARRRADRLDALAARRDRLDALEREARSAAWRGVAIVGIERIGGWMRISFVDGKSWLLRTDTAVRSLRALVGGPLVVQRASRDLHRSTLADRTDCGVVELTLYSLLGGERRLVALDATC